MLNPLKLIVVALLVAGSYFGFHSITHYHHKVEIQKLELKSSQLKAKTLEMEYDQALKQLDNKNATEQQLKEAQDKLQQLDKEKRELEAQLQAKASQKRSNTVYAATLPANGCSVGNTSANYALAQLIQHESGGRSCAENAGACFGLLQACPGSPLKIACGGDAACQLDWFARVKLPTYGTWENAWAKWQSRCGSKDGCWW